MTEQAKKTTAELADEARLKRELIQLESEELRLEETREATAQRKGERARVVLTRQQIESAAKQAIGDRRRLHKACKHKQGSQNGQVYNGKRLTALKVEKMPDGFTIRIRCLACRMQVSSPFPPDGFKKQRPGESVAERDARLVKFDEAKKEFMKLYEASQDDVLTAEAAQPMEPGTTFKFTDANGNQIYKPRPSDSYAVEAAA